MMNPPAPEEADAVPPNLDGVLLEPLKLRGKREPLFLIPGGWGGRVEVELCAALSEGWESWRSVIGVQSGARILGHKPAPDLANHGARIMAEIRQAGFSGPYHVVGECLAAPIALAVSAAAAAAGVECGTVILLDPWLPGKSGLSWIGRWRDALGFESPKVRQRPRVLAYYRMAKTEPPPVIDSDLHVLVGSDRPGIRNVRMHWQQFTRGRVHLHGLSAGHHELLRSGAEETRQVIQQLIQTT